MDKGLDIEVLRCAAALHAALYGNHYRLVKALAALIRARAGGNDGSALRAEADSILLPADRPDAWRAADRALDWMACPGNAVVILGDDSYPPLLSQIATPPPLLYVSGEPQSLLAPQFAIVGSRRATPQGSENAHLFARVLCQAGFTITSGLAVGIDSAAHRGALAAAGRTIAVLGCGIDYPYPRANAKLAAEIRQTGALLSEFPLGLAPKPFHFPRRNRIVSGMAAGTLVVEAASTSGSISTALHALEQGRDVFAIPGSIRNPLTAGCHDLIRQGATLARNPADVLDELGVSKAYCQTDPPAQKPAGTLTGQRDLSTNESTLLGFCDFDPTPFDLLVDRSGLTAPQVSSILLALEVKGYVQSLAGGTYAKTGSATGERY